MSKGKGEADVTTQVYPSTRHVWYGHEKNFCANGANFTLQGHAISAEASAFYIREWRIMLDAGIACPYKADAIFITHSHCDHAAQLPTILTGNNGKPDVYVPHGTAALYRDLLLAKHRLSKCDPLLPEQSVAHMCTFIECAVGDEFDLSVGKAQSRMRVKILATDHRVKSIGFAFFLQRTRLLQCHRTKSGAELQALRKSGANLTEQYFAPQLIYTGDTTTRWFEQNKRFLATHRFPFVITECTFVDDLERDALRAVDSATQYTHTCWSKLRPCIEALLREQADAISHDDGGKRSHFILVHWSKRYAWADLALTFQNVPSVSAWLW